MGPIEELSKQSATRTPVFIIAEAGVNHNGDLALARALVDAASEAGADAVKFQTFTAEGVAVRKAPKADYQIAATGVVESQYEMLKRLELSLEAHQELLAYCRSRGILFLSTPHDMASIDLLDRLGVEALKVGSGDLTNWPFLKTAASKKKPLILSTGMATLDEVRDAVDVIRKHGDPPLILLHCVTQYPAKPEEMNLSAMRTMAQVFGCPVGLSDHTMGAAIALAAVALGARLIEKHLTLDRTMPGPDHRASLEPGEFKAMVEGIRAIEQAIGDGVKRPTAGESRTREVARKSIVAACDIAAGDNLEPHMLAMKRPGTGIPPGELSKVLGRKLVRAIAADEMIGWSDLS